MLTRARRYPSTARRIVPSSGCRIGIDQDELSRSKQVRMHHRRRNNCIFVEARATKVSFVYGLTLVNWGGSGDGQADNGASGAHYLPAGARDPVA
ncbi:MAG: hypothetical protein QOF70_3502 [Acetobacteraceae bacterium]|jgi:hypothetical protein|nr:hypothetical protein [Acetobacteraceae bacterium]